MKVLLNLIKNFFGKTESSNLLKIKVGGYNTHDDLGYYGSYNVISGKVRRIKTTRLKGSRCLEIILAPITNTAKVEYIRIGSKGSMYRGQKDTRIVELNKKSTKKIIVI